MRTTRDMIGTHNTTANDASCAMATPGVQKLCQALLLTLALSPLTAFAQGIDVGFQVDESGSMSPYQTAIQNNVNVIAAALPQGSFGAVVGYGGYPYYPQVECSMIDLGTDLATFENCSRSLTANGGTEPAYDAITQSADGTLPMGFTGNPYCAVLFTDEPSNGDIATQQDAIDAMTAIGGVFFGVASVGPATSSLQPIADATGGQMFDLAAFGNDPVPVLEAIIDACEVAVVAGQARMNGGGRLVDENGAKVTHGFAFQCNNPTAAGSNFSVSFGGNHFQMDTLDSVRCSDSDQYDEGTPVVGVDTLIASGSGTYNGVAGATFEAALADRGEPGRNDTASIVIRDSSGVVVLSVTESLAKGNIQALPATN